MVDITRRLEDVYGTATRGSFFTKGSQVESGDTDTSIDTALEAAQSDIRGLRTDVDSITPGTRFSAAAYELFRNLRQTHAAGDILYPHAALRVVQLNITDRGTRAGTLYGDTTGITYSSTAGNIDGWSDGLSGNERWAGTIIGHRLAALPGRPSSGRFTPLTQSENDDGTAFGVLEINTQGELVMQNPVVADDRMEFRTTANVAYVPAVGDWIYLEFEPNGERTLDVILDVRFANGTWQTYRNVFFTVPAGTTPTPQSSFNLAEYHIQHANVGNTQAVFDIIFFLRHDYIRHDDFPNIFTDFTTAAPASIGNGNRIVGEGAALLEFTEGIKIPNTSVVRNAADDADLNIADELAKIGSGEGGASLPTENKSDGRVLTATGPGEDDQDWEDPFDGRNIPFSVYVATGTATLPTPDLYNAINKSTSSTTAFTLTIPSAGYGRKYTIMNPSAGGDFNIRTSADATLHDFFPGDTGIIVVSSTGTITRITRPALPYYADRTLSLLNQGDRVVTLEEMNNLTTIRIRGTTRLVTLPQLPPQDNRQFVVLADGTLPEQIVRGTGDRANEMVFPPASGAYVFVNSRGLMSFFAISHGTLPGQLPTDGTADLATVVATINAFLRTVPVRRAVTSP